MPCKCEMTGSLSMEQRSKRPNIGANYENKRGRLLVS